MYLARDRTHEERRDAYDAFPKRIDGYNFSWVNTDGREEFRNIGSLIASLLVPEFFGDPPPIEHYQVAAMLDTLVGMEVISAETAHDAFSMIAPHVHLELFHVDRATQRIIMPEQEQATLFRISGH